MGFNMWMGSTLKSFQSYFYEIRRCLTSGEEKINLRSLRDYVQEISFGCAIIETQDRRKLRAILASFFHPTVVNESAPIPDCEGIPIPDEMGLVSYQQALNGIMLFHGSEGTLLNRVTGESLVKWNRSLWLSRPFFYIIPPQTLGSFGIEDVEQSVCDLLKMLPSPIPADLEVGFQPLMLFWISEIRFFNKVIEKVRSDLSERRSDVIEDIMRDRVPHSWMLLSQVIAFNQLGAFMVFLIGKWEFLSECLRNPFCSEIRGLNIRDLRGFFVAFQLEFACENEMKADSLHLEFFPPGDYEKHLVIHGLFLCNAVIDKGSLAVAKGNRVFVPAGDLWCRVSDRGREGYKNKFICPLFKCVMMKGLIIKELVAMYDGQTDNFVRDILLPTARGDRSFLLNGTALYCQIPWQFA
jgi:hypothetical protein